VGIYSVGCPMEFSAHFTDGGYAEGVFIA